MKSCCRNADLMEGMWKTKLPFSGGGYNCSIKLKKKFMSSFEGPRVKKEKVAGYPTEEREQFLLFGKLPEKNENLPGVTAWLKERASEPLQDQKDRICENEAFPPTRLKMQKRLQADIDFVNTNLLPVLTRVLEYYDKSDFVEREVEAMQGGMANGKEFSVAVEKWKKETRQIFERGDMVAIKGILKGLLGRVYGGHIHPLTREVGGLQYEYKGLSPLHQEKSVGRELAKTIWALNERLAHFKGVHDYLEELIACIEELDKKVENTEEE